MWKGHSGLRLEWLGPWSRENQGYEVLLTSAIKGRMWVKQCHKPPIWEWFIISNYLWWFRGWLIIVVPTLVSLVSLVEWSVFLAFSILKFRYPTASRGNSKSMCKLSGFNPWYPAVHGASSCHVEWQGHLISSYISPPTGDIQIFSWSPSMLHRPICLVPKSSFFTKKTAGSFPKFDIHDIRCRCPEILTLPICSMQLSINLRLAAPSGSLKLKGLNLTSKWFSGKVNKNTKEGGI